MVRARSIKEMGTIMIFKRKKEMIHFSGRKHSIMGICSAAIGVFVVAGFLTLSMISGLAGGKGSFYLGIIGIFLFFLSIFGFVLSYKAFKKKDIFFRFPLVGAVLNGIMTVLFLIIYILGV
jgi:hypothetical protein